MLGVLQIIAGNTANSRWHCGRKQSNLTFLRQLRHDPLNVVNKAHAQHFIGLVQHQMRQVIEFKAALAHVVHNTPRGTYNNLRAAL